VTPVTWALDADAAFADVRSIYENDDRLTGNR